MSQAFHMFQLQKIDSQIDQNNYRIMEINRFLESDVRLSDAKSNFEEKLDTLRKSQNQLKRIEQDVTAKRLKLEQSENNLYSGRVHVPKELQDIQSEVASLKRFIGTLEDQQLEAMLTVEADQAESEKAHTILQKIEAEVTTDQASMRGEVQRRANENERLMVERNLLANQVNDENRALYDKLRKSRKGIAVAAIVDSSCSACGSTLTPAECQAARSPQYLIFCPSCGRIVYGG